MRMASALNDDWGAYTASLKRENIIGNNVGQCGGEIRR